MKRILLIEDEPQLRSNIVELLEMSGYEVDHVEQAEAGVEQLVKETYDLILCDVSLPGLEGYYVLEELMKTDLVIPFIFLSARVNMENIRKGLILGADDYIMKPFESKVLLTAVKTQLAKYDRIRRILKQ